MEALAFPKTLQRYGQLLTVGSVVVISGRISVREEEDAKLLCEKVMTIEDRLAFRNGLPPRKAVSAPSGGKSTWAVPESTVTAGDGDGKSAESFGNF